MLRLSARPALVYSLLVGGTTLASGTRPACAHHDSGPQLPLSINLPGNVGGLSNPGTLTQSNVGFGTRAFRVSDHSLYNGVIGGDATVLLNALQGTVGIGRKVAATAMLPMVSDLPEGGVQGHTGLGDVRLGLRWLATNNDAQAWSIAGEASLPTGNTKRGFGAGAVVSRVSARLSHDVSQQLRLFAEAGVALAWNEVRGTMADAALASVWQATAVVGLFFEARVLTAVEQGKIELVGRARKAGDTSVVLTPALTVAAGEHVSAALGPQIPLGFKDFDIGFAASVTYRP